MLATAFAERGWPGLLAGHLDNEAVNRMQPIPFGARRSPLGKAGWLVFVGWVERFARPTMPLQRLVGFAKRSTHPTIEYFA